MLLSSQFQPFQIEERYRLEIHNRKKHIQHQDKTQKQTSTTPEPISSIMTPSFARSTTNFLLLLFYLSVGCNSCSARTISVELPLPPVVCFEMTHEEEVESRIYCSKTDLQETNPKDFYRNLVGRKRDEQNRSNSPTTKRNILNAMTNFVTRIPSKIQALSEQLVTHVRMGIDFGEDEHTTLQLLEFQTLTKSI